MLFAVSFTNHLDKEDLRVQHLQAHIDWLEDNKEVIPIGGALKREFDQVPVGGLWIANAKSKAQLDELLRTDPFYLCGLRMKHEIYYWFKTNKNRKVEL